MADVVHTYRRPLLIRKFTRIQLAPETAWSPGMARTSRLSDFDFTPEPGMLYVTARAISSRVNANYDGWPAPELRKAYRTFVGRGVFVDHNNWDTDRSRGVILDSRLYEDRLASGHEDTWIELLIEVDSEAFPRLAQAILAGDIDAVSMGADVEYTVCSVCSNKAHDVREYCAHIPTMKGRTAAGADGSEVLVFEDCYGVNFFEISFVFDPADESALISDKMLFAGASERTASHVRRRGERVDQYRARLRKAAKKASSDEDYIGDLGYEAGELAADRGEGSEPDFDRAVGANPALAADFRAMIAEMGEARVREIYEAAFRRGYKAYNGTVAGRSRKEETMTRNPRRRTSEAIMALPDEVDTMRQDQMCPACGKEFDGLRCDACGYEQPPPGLDAPSVQRDDAAAVADDPNAAQQDPDEQVDAQQDVPAVPGEPATDPALDQTAGPVEEPLPADPEIVGIVDEAIKEIVRKRIDTLLGGPAAEAAPVEDGENPFAEKDEDGAEGEGDEDSEDAEDAADPEKAKDKAKPKGKGKGNPFAPKTEGGPKKSTRTASDAPRGPETAFCRRGNHDFCSTLRCACECHAAAARSRAAGADDLPAIAYEGTDGRWYHVGCVDRDEVVGYSWFHPELLLANAGDAACAVCGGKVVTSARTAGADDLRAETYTARMDRYYSNWAASLRTEAPADDPWKGDELSRLEYGLDVSYFDLVEDVDDGIADSDLKPVVREHQRMLLDQGRRLLSLSASYRRTAGSAEERATESSDLRQIADLIEDFEFEQADEIAQHLYVAAEYDAAALEEVVAFCSGAQRIYVPGREVEVAEVARRLADTIDDEVGETTASRRRDDQPRDTGQREAVSDRRTRDRHERDGEDRPWRLLGIVAWLGMSISSNERVRDIDELTDLMLGMGEGETRSLWVQPGDDPDRIAPLSIGYTGDAWAIEVGDAIGTFLTQDGAAWAFSEAARYFTASRRASAARTASPDARSDWPGSGGGDDFDEDDREMVRRRRDPEKDFESWEEDWYGDLAMRPAARAAGLTPTDARDATYEPVDADGLLGLLRGVTRDLDATFSIGGFDGVVGLAPDSRAPRGLMTGAYFMVLFPSGSMVGPALERHGVAGSPEEAAAWVIAETGAKAATRRANRRTSALTARQEAILRSYAESELTPSVSWEGLPSEVRSALKRAKDSETLPMDAERFLFSFAAQSVRDRGWAGFSFGNRTAGADWGRVEAAVRKALLVAWDGCHKIYVAMDAGQADWFRAEYPHTVGGDSEQMMDALRDWWDDSCPLRFVNGVSSDRPGGSGPYEADYDDLIPQFEDDDEDDRYSRRGSADGDRSAADYGVPREAWVMDESDEFFARTDGWPQYTYTCKVGDGFSGGYAEAWAHFRDEHEDLIDWRDHTGSRRTAVRVGDPTPWGRADMVEQIAGDVWYVNTPSHGGYKLGPASNEKARAWARSNGVEHLEGKQQMADLGELPLDGYEPQQGFTNVGDGWYEEDDAWVVPVLALPILFPTETVASAMKQFERHRERGYYSAKSDGPCTCWDGYERVPGTEPCESGSCRRKSKKADRSLRDYQQPGGGWAVRCLSCGGESPVADASELIGGAVCRACGGTDVELMSPRTSHVHTAHCGEEGCPCELCGKECGGDCAMTRNKKGAASEGPCSSCGGETRRTAKPCPGQRETMPSGMTYRSPCGGKLRRCVACSGLSCDCGYSWTDTLASTDNPVMGDDFICDGCKSQQVIDYAVVVPGSEEILCPECAGVDWEEARIYNVNRGLVAASVRRTASRTAGGDDDGAPECESCGTRMEVVPALYPESDSDEDAYEAECPKCGAIRKGSALVEPMPGVLVLDDDEDEDYHRCAMCGGPIYLLGGQWARCRNCGMDQRVRSASRTASITAADVRAAIDDDDHHGFGFAIVDDLPVSQRDRSIRAVAQVADALGLSKGELFVWVDSKFGRKLVDELSEFARSSNQEGLRAIVAKYLNRAMVDELKADDPRWFDRDSGVTSARERRTAAMAGPCGLCGGTGCGSCFSTGIVQIASRTAEVLRPAPCLYCGEPQTFGPHLHSVPCPGCGLDLDELIDIDQAAVPYCVNCGLEHPFERAVAVKQTGDENNWQRFTSSTASRTAGYGPKGNWAANWLECQVCGKEFGHWVHRVNHYKKNHPDVDPRTADTGPSSGEVEMPRAASRTAAKCPLCDHDLATCHDLRYLRDEMALPTVPCACWDVLGDPSPTDDLDLGPVEGSSS